MQESTECVDYPECSLLNPHWAECEAILRLCQIWSILQRFQFRLRANPFSFVIPIFWSRQNWFSFSDASSYIKKQDGTHTWKQNKCARKWWFIKQVGVLNFLSGACEGHARLFTSELPIFFHTECTSGDLPIHSIFKASLLWKCCEETSIQEGLTLVLQYESQQQKNASKWRIEVSVFSCSLDYRKGVWNWEAAVTQGQVINPTFKVMHLFTKALILTFSCV